MTIEILSHVEIDVRRPDGVVETVIRDNRVIELQDSEFEKMRAATAAAGRGELLAYRNVTKRIPAPQPTAAELAEDEHIRRTNAIYRASAGGEPCDQIGGLEDVDRTPAHKEDY